MIRICGLVIQTDGGRQKSITKVIKSTENIVRSEVRSIKREYNKIKLLPRIQELIKAVNDEIENIKNADIDIQVKGEISRPLYKTILDPLNKLGDDVQKTGEYSPKVKKRPDPAVQ